MRTNGRSKGNGLMDIGNWIYWIKTGYDVAKMVTSLFDGIGHHFFEYKKLFDRISKSAGQLTWEVIMGFYGKDDVFRYYGINKKGYMNCLEVFNIHV